MTAVVMFSRLFDCLCFQNLATDGFSLVANGHMTLLVMDLFAQFRLVKFLCVCFTLRVCVCVCVCVCVVEPQCV